MKQFQNNFTTPEQSKKLLELGVPADSADCFEDILSYIRVRRTSNELSRDFFSHYATLTPCWSVGRLIEILSKCMPSGLYTPKFHIEDNIIDVVLDAIELELNYGLDFSKLED